ncbi:hypothetical protein ACOMHN_018290 [Nucella lapillus]
MSSKRGLFRWKKNLSISGQDPSYKVRYLGNVQTTLMKGEGCVDKAASTIWANYQRSHHPGLDMKLVVTSSGLKAFTKEQGLTEYRAHRISYCIAHPEFPRLFIWVYRHEGKRMKPEMRCHALLCRSEVKAKAMALQLHERLTQALQEFHREKVKKQNSRQVLLRTNSLPKAGCVLPLRTQMLSTGNNFKPPISKSASAPKLGAIHEDLEEEEEEEEDGGDALAEEEEEEILPFSQDLNVLPPGGGGGGAKLQTLNLKKASGRSTREEFQVHPFIDVEMGNDIEQLRRDRDVQFCVQDTSDDSDDDSSESGFHDQEDKGQSVVGEGQEAVGREGEGEKVILNPMGDEEVDQSS